MSTFATNASRHSLKQPAHLYPQTWFLIITVSLFLAYLAWDQPFVRDMLKLDKSYMAAMIGALTVLSSSHAAYHLFSQTKRIRDSLLFLAEPNNQSNVDEDSCITAFLHDLHTSAEKDQLAKTDALIEIHADTLRAPVDFGWFLVDLAVRMGLLGTIIGFMLIFTSLSSTSLNGAEGLQDLLVSMSGGMGTALLTTLSGLLAASFLSLQYLVLARQTEFQIGLLIRLRNQFLDGSSH